MVFHKTFVVRILILIIVGTLLTRCTDATGPDSSTATGQSRTATSTPLRPTDTPSASITSTREPEIAETRETTTPTPIPGPTDSSSERGESTSVPAPTPTGTRTQQGEETNVVNAPLVVGLVHIDPETFTQIDNEGLYLAELDGKVIDRLTSNNTDYAEPTWSPACRQIAFVGNPETITDVYYSQLFTMTVAGERNPTRVETPLQSHRSPAWSPNGEFLLFAGDDGESTQIYTYSLREQKITQLTTEGNNYEPDWSPDNASIVFVSDRDENGPFSTSIYIMNADGSEQRRLLPHFWGADPSTFDEPGIYNPQSPAWSPDGQWIAFRVTEDVKDREAGKIYVTSLDGSDIRRVVPGNRRNDDTGSEDFYFIFESEPSWSPDGQQILYLRSHPFRDESAICIVDLFSGENVCNSIDRQEIIWSADWCSVVGE